MKGRSYRFRKKRLLVATIAVVAFLSAIYIEKNYKIEVVRFAIENYEETFQVEEEASFEKVFLLCPSREDKLKKYKKKIGFWGPYTYYVEITTKITNTSEKNAVFKAYNWIETIQDGYLDGGEQEIELAPMASYQLYSRIELPSGRDTKFPSRGFVGCEVEPSKILVEKKNFKCRWVSYKRVCYSFLKDCENQDVSELDPGCDLP